MLFASFHLDLVKDFAIWDGRNPIVPTFLWGGFDRDSEESTHCYPLRIRIVIGRCLVIQQYEVVHGF